MSVKKLIVLASALAVLASSCRSSSRRDCYTRERWDCVAALAEIALERDPSCCACLHDQGIAEEHHALAAAGTSLTPPQTVLALMRAADLLDRAVVCSGRQRFGGDRDEARQRYRDVVADLYEPLWSRTVALTDPSRRVRAVTEHQTYFGDRCRHDVKTELRHYLNQAGMLTLTEIRRDLLDLPDTPVADDLLKLYCARRMEGSAAEVDSLEALRRDFIETPHADAVNRIIELRLAARAESSEDAAEVETLCEHMTTSERERCRDRAQTMWAQQVEAANDISELDELCKHMRDVQTRRRCKSRVAQYALDEAKRDPSPENFARAEQLSRTDPATRYEWNLLAFRKSVDESFQRVENGLSEDVTWAPPSIQTWARFVATFDGVAEELFPGESLRTVHPRLVDKVDARVLALKRDAADALAKAEQTNDCGNVAAKSERLSDVERCIELTIAVLQMDQDSDRAHNLLNSLDVTRARLSSRPRPWKWSEVVIPLALAATIRNFLPPSFGRLVVRIITYGVGQQ